MQSYYATETRVFIAHHPGRLKCGSDWWRIYYCLFRGCQRYSEADITLKIPCQLDVHLAFATQCLYKNNYGASEWWRHCTPVANTSTNLGTSSTLCGLSALLNPTTEYSVAVYSILPGFLLFEMSEAFLACDDLGQPSLVFYEFPLFWLVSITSQHHSQCGAPPWKIHETAYVIIWRKGNTSMYVSVYLARPDNVVPFALWVRPNTDTNWMVGVGCRVQQR